jgi:hypothetical protein
MARETKLKARRAVYAALLLLISIPVMGDPQGGKLVTINAGTPVPLVPNASTVNPVLVNSIFIQAQHGGSGIIYVLNCNPQTTCSKGNATTILVAEIPAATTTAPGGWFRFPTNGSASNGSGGTDLRYWQVDGANSGDVAICSWDVRQ